MSDTAVKLAELLCARLCHDLAGPVGAVATGAELLEDEGDGMSGMAAEALALLAGSAAAAGARLRFLRLALGAATGPQPMGPLKDVAAAFLAGSGAADSIRLDWAIPAKATWDGGKVKILFNLLLLARDCLPRGGAIVAAEAADGGLSLRAEGPGARPGDQAAALNAASPEGLSPREIQGYYTGLLLAAAKMTIEISAAMESVAFRAGCVILG
ncbi:hypothetical protein GALL_268080 [mine drainage metagenome]|uniref:Histidine phosphotransferase ChpT C-terminal domain-containing protein n=1 Tax=mine drainage metagenome TaxID=410659 RepID=A0A1J5R7B3_9ZZZZ